jgi:hypothetical protein
VIIRTAEAAALFSAKLINRQPRVFQTLGINIGISVCGRPMTSFVAKKT